MKSDKNKEMLVKLIQASLTGYIDPSSNFNPSFLADAIITKLELNQTIKERMVKDVNEAITAFNNMIDDIDKDMDLEMQQLGSEEVLLKNFVRGQKTTCEKLKDSLNNL